MALILHVECRNWKYRAFVDFLVNHENEPAILSVTCSNRPARTTAELRFQRIADHRFHVFGCNAMFGNVLDIASGFMVPNEIIPRHGASLQRMRFIVASPAMYSTRKLVWIRLECFLLRDFFAPRMMLRQS